MQLPFIGGSYNLESRPASVQRSVNLIPVPLEVGNERAPWTLKDVPGLVEVLDPSSVDPFFAYVRSLLHFEDTPGTSIPVDVIPGVVWSNSDATKAQVSLLQARFGNSSLARQTTGAGGLYTNHFSSLPGAFTFEFFIKFTSFPFAQRRIFALSDFTGLPGALVIKADVGFFGVDGATIAASTIPAIIGPWYHVAATYDGANISLWIDGVLALSYAWLSVMTGAFTFSPGCAFGFNGDFVQQYLDEFRFTSGIARYTSTFTPPDRAFPDR